VLFTPKPWRLKRLEIGKLGVFRQNLHRKRAMPGLDRIVNKAVLNDRREVPQT
jgi:hypothetical protein